ncbi:MAG: ATP-binding protein [Acidimicrobiales bacterium]
MDPAAMPREEAALERSLLTAVAVFRWAALAWTTVVIVIDARNDSFERLGLAVVLLVASAAFTGWATLAVRVDPHRVAATGALAVEGAIALGLSLADGLAYGNLPNSSHSQSLGTIWPLAWVLTVGIRFGAGGGLVAGCSIGSAQFLSTWLFSDKVWRGDDWVGALGSVVLYGLGGAIAGFAAARLREAEREVALARAREEVARTLHDGVLQTLAVVQRRSDDEELVQLARDQEQDLRSFLFGTSRGRRRGRSAGVDLEAALRDAATHAERRHGLRTQVVVAGELSLVAAPLAEAVQGAVAEALTNAAKHGEATHATVFVDPGDDGELFCSVKDDGAGFDPAATEEGVGLSRSIRGRVEDVGGRVEVDSRPGRGTEVRIHVTR